jgi:hypothetical protein
LELRRRRVSRAPTRSKRGAAGAALEARPDVAADAASAARTLETHDALIVRVRPERDGAMEWREG